MRLKNPAKNRPVANGPEAKCPEPNGLKCVTALWAQDPRVPDPGANVSLGEPSWRQTVGG